MAIRHVVCFKFVDDVDPASVEALRDALAELGASLGEVLTYELGRDVGANAASWDFAVSATFGDAAGYLSYRDNPRHQEIISEMVNPITAERVSVQFEL
ncbi:MAG: Dabb family protein [Acidimicrobiales bacterium]|nr:Dabb family protein [Acidimicrobiales bacterium]